QHQRIVVPPTSTMKENPLQYRVRGTPVPTTRTRGTNYPKSTSVAITFALGLVIGTTGASWLNPLLPVERSEVNQAGMDESFNLVPGNTISSTPLDSGKALLEFYPNTAFWTAQGFYALLWVVTALILLCLTHYFFKRSSRNVA
ncbi:hypothetical protein ACL1CU_14125, partial [Corynebacterium striatum]